MTNTEGDINGLIMMCIMNKLTGQTPLFGEWGEFGIKENAMQIMMHGYADPDYAKNPGHVKITATPENWGYAGKGFSMEFTAKPGVVTVGHFINDKEEGWRMLIAKGEAVDAEKSIPCEDVTLILKTEIPIKEFIQKILIVGFDHHAIICYGDVTEELGYIADLMGIKKNYI
jgi:L-arabinose isomerase